MYHEQFLRIHKTFGQFSTSNTQFKKTLSKIWRYQIKGRGEDFHLTWLSIGTPTKLGTWISVEPVSSTHDRCLNSLLILDFPPFGFTPAKYLFGVLLLTRHA